MYGHVIGKNYRMTNLISKVIKIHFNGRMERMDNFKKILEEALKAPTLTEVERDGKLLRSIKTDYENEYHDADSSGGDWREAYLYLYNGQKYIVIYKCVNFPFVAKECIRFGATR